MKSVVEKAVATLRQEALERDCSLGEKICMELRRLLQSRFNSSSSGASVQAPSQSGAPSDSATSASGSSPAVFPCYAWGGKFHRLPEGFKIPTVIQQQICLSSVEQCAQVTIFVAWQRYNLGNATEKWPPLKVVPTKDFSLPAARKRFSDLKLVCIFIEEEALKAGLQLAVSPTEEWVCGILRLHLSKRANASGPCLVPGFKACALAHSAGRNCDCQW